MFDLTKAQELSDLVTKEEILEYVSQEEIFEHYFEKEIILKHLHRIVKNYRNEIFYLTQTHNDFTLRNILVEKDDDFKIIDWDAMIHPLFPRVASIWNVVLVQAGNAPGIHYVELDRAEVDRARKRVPALTHDRDFELPT